MTTMTRSARMMIDPIALGLDVRRVNRNECSVICPYHDDHEPSAYFNAERGLFHCFACGVGKTARQIAEDLETEVVKVPSLRVPGAHVVGGPVIDWTSLLTLPLALDHSYLAFRGVTNDTVRDFGIRQMPGAVVFPVRDKWGHVKGVMIRQMSRRKSRRYMYLGDKQPMWPFDRFFEDPNPHKRNVFVVEGIFGAINARQHGIEAYAIMGATSIREASYALLGLKTFKILFDDDIAGYVGATSLMLATRFHGRVLLPGAEADEITREVWDRMLIEEGTVSEYKVAEFVEDKDAFIRRVKRWRP